MREHKNWLTEEEAIKKLGTDKADLDSLVAGQQVRAIVDGDKGLFVYNPEDINDVLEDRMLATPAEGCKDELQGLDFGEGFDEPLSLGAGEAEVVSSETTETVMTEPVVKNPDEPSGGSSGLAVFALLLALISVGLNVLLASRLMDLEDSLAKPAVVKKTAQLKINPVPPPNKK
jgi:hypothetical protein